MNRSSQFRALIVENLDEFLELSLGVNPKRPPSTTKIKLLNI